MGWMWYLVGAILLYVAFGKQIRKYIKIVKIWIDKNKEKIEEWKKVPEIELGYEALVDSITVAQLDKKWSVSEILLSLGILATLINSIIEYEEGRLKNGKQQSFKSKS